MKKIALLLGALIVSTGLFAQKANIKKAENELYQEPVNYDKAIAYIDMAKQDSTTAELSDTWYTAGRIGYDMAYKEMNKLYLQQQPDYVAMGKGLDMMFTNYMEANKYDSYLDKKGRVKYENRKKMVADFKEMHSYYINAGINAGDQNRDFETGYKLLNEYLEISDSEMFAEKSIKVEDTYNDVKYQAAIYAYRVERFEDAIRLFEELKQAKYKENVMVVKTLSDLYFAKADTLKAESTLEEAIAADPANTDLIGLLTEHYLKVGQSQKAVESLDKLVNSDPSNIQYVLVKAQVLAYNMKEFDKAKETLQQLFDNGSAKDNATIIFTMGEIYGGEGNEKKNISDYIDDDKEYKKVVEESKACFSKALEYYKQAKGIMSVEDANYEILLKNIRQIYMLLGQTGSDEYKAINEEIKSLGF
jgi:Tfp pilus assembly protein PilF